MSALIVGGDRIDSYRGLLQKQGYTQVRHWNGRKQSECHRRIPVDTQLVVVMIDQINHGLARKIRREADERSLPIVFSRRNAGQMDAALTAVLAAAR